MSAGDNPFEDRGTLIAPAPATSTVADEDQTLAIWAELMRRGFAVQNDQTTPAEEKRRLLTEIVDLGKRARDGGLPTQDWENHELNWAAYYSNLRKNLVRELARALIEQERSTAPLTPEMEQVLYWWRNEGGREEFLSELPIEERKALEKRER